MESITLKTVKYTIVDMGNKTKSTDRFVKLIPQENKKACIKYGLISADGSSFRRIKL